MPVQNRAVVRGLADNNATHKDKRTERGQNQRTTRREEMNMKKLFLILASVVVLSSCADSRTITPPIKISELNADKINELLGGRK